MDKGNEGGEAGGDSGGGVGCVWGGGGWVELGTKPTFLLPGLPNSVAGGTGTGTQSAELIPVIAF